MPLRDFAILVLICMAWAMNAIVTKVVVSTAGIPPMFFVSGRFILLLAIVFPWLRPLPEKLGSVILVGMLMGAGVFGLGFMGMRTSSPSAVAVVQQLSIPMTVVLSYFLLRERLDGRRAGGIALALAGSLLVMWNPGGAFLSPGLLFVVGGALCAALGTILMKRIANVSPMQFQAWVCLSSLPVVALCSLLFEHDQFAALAARPAYFFGGILFNGLVVSLLAHTTFYGLIRRYDASLLAPLTLMTPLLTILFGVWLTHDLFGPRMAVGAAAALTGVLLIAVQPSQWMLLAARLRGARP